MKAIWKKLEKQGIFTQINLAEVEIPPELHSTANDRMLVDFNQEYPVLLPLGIFLRAHGVGDFSYLDFSG